MQNKLYAVDVENAESEIPEEINLVDFNDFHLEYNEATNISTFQEISCITIAGGAKNVPIFNLRFGSSITGSDTNCSDNTSCDDDRNWYLEAE